MTWLKYNRWKLPQSFLIETKVSYGKSFPFNNLSEKEERLLLKAKHSAVLHTFSDYSQLGTPCDAVCISGGGLIFLQYVRRANKKFYVIDIDNFLNEKGSSKRKSLLEPDAERISYLVGELK